MVREITKEQNSGKKQKRRFILVALGVVILVLAALDLFEFTPINVKPQDYRLTVEEITLEDVHVYEDKGIATYQYDVE